jgi:Ca2+-binding RTX toxin-like protein
MTLRLTFAIVLVLGIVSVAYAITATNSVPSTNAGQSSQATGANDLKPAACNWNLTNLVIGVTGTAGNDLILGTGGGQTIRGGGGRDCIIAGAGNDTLQGNSRKVGGAPVFAGDYCDGGPGADTVSTFNAGGTTYPTCDTQVNIP